ncbi:hypothetical protein AK812_SmicGene46740, partial [Symbiodinium microadriaticum]
ALALLAQSREDSVRGAVAAVCARSAMWAHSLAGVAYSGYGGT